MDFSFSELNSVKTLPGFEARAAFTVNSTIVFRENVDIMPTIVDNTIVLGGDERGKWQIHCGVGLSRIYTQEVSHNKEKYPEKPFRYFSDTYLLSCWFSALRAEREAEQAMFQTISNKFQI